MLKKARVLLWAVAVVVSRSGGQHLLARRPTLPGHCFLRQRGRDKQSQCAFLSHMLEVEYAIEAIKQEGSAFFRLLEVKRLVFDADKKCRAAFGR